VHSPIRYAWDEQFSYLQQGNLGFGPKGLLFRYLMHRLRLWDARTAHGPDLMLANSSYVRARIRRVYGIDSRVVFPPVDVDEAALCTDKDDYYVTAAFLAPYKRTDLVVDAFNAMPTRKLLVVGDGQQAAKLKDRAGPNIAFAGYLPRAEYIKAVSRARALVFAGCEDFGIALAEAQAYGTPLIAFARGGAMDIVRPLGRTGEPTGVLFEHQTVQSVIDAVRRFDINAEHIRPLACRNNAMRFNPERFARELYSAFASTVEVHTPFGTNAHVNQIAAE
jgi:glycosyltransferase involved in cell wall biosynthesis